MKIIVFQKDKKISIEFYHSKFVDRFVVDKSEDFLSAIDKFFRKRRIKSIGPICLIGPIDFKNTGALTERVVRSIMLGLCFSVSKLA